MPDPVATESSSSYSPPVAAGACLNCGAPLTGEYCASCGQKTPRPDLTLGEFLADATQELTQLEGKVPTTLKALFFRPGLLTLDYLAGRRARWLPPLRLYLICSLAFFVINSVIGTVSPATTRDMARFTLTNSDGSTTLTPEGRRELEQGLPARIFGVDRLIRASSNAPQLNRTIKSAFPKAMFILLPIFSLLTRIAWRRRLPRYPAHLYLALHLHAAWFGALAIGAIGTAILAPVRAGGIVTAALLAYVTWYGLMTVRRVGGDSWMMTVGKSALIVAAYSVCLFPVGLLLLAWALFQA
jgi:hypothetical protein